MVSDPDRPAPASAGAVLLFRSTVVRLNSRSRIQVAPVVSPFVGLAAGASLRSGYRTGMSPRLNWPASAVRSLWVLASSPGSHGR